MTDDSQSKASEFVKKALTVGLGTIFLTEEKLRTLVNDAKLPKELLDGLLESASKSREKFFKGMTAEFLDKLTSKADINEMVSEFLSENKMKLKMDVEIDFEPKKSKKSSS